MEKIARSLPRAKQCSLLINENFAEMKIDVQKTSLIAHVRESTASSLIFFSDAVMWCWIESRLLLKENQVYAINHFSP